MFLSPVTAGEAYSCTSSFIHRVSLRSGPIDTFPAGRAAPDGSVCCFRRPFPLNDTVSDLCLSKSSRAASLILCENTETPAHTLPLFIVVLPSAPLSHISTVRHRKEGAVEGDRLQSSPSSSSSSSNTHTHTLYQEPEWVFILPWASGRSGTKSQHFQG